MYVFTYTKQSKNLNVEEKASTGNCNSKPSLTRKINKFIISLTWTTELFAIIKGRPQNEYQASSTTQRVIAKEKEYLIIQWSFKTLVLELENPSKIPYLNQQKEVKEFARSFSKLLRTLNVIRKQECLAAVNDDWEILFVSICV